MPVDVRHTHISYYFYFIPTKKAAKPINQWLKLIEDEKKIYYFQ